MRQGVRKTTSFSDKLGTVNTTDGALSSGFAAKAPLFWWQNMALQRPGNRTAHEAPG